MLNSLTSKCMNKKEKSVIQVNTDNLAKTMRNLSEQYGDGFSILNKTNRWAYRFPFLLKRNYELKIEVVEEKEVNIEEIDKHKKESILKQLSEQKQQRHNEIQIENEVKIKKHLHKRGIDEEIIERFITEIKSEMKINISEKEAIELLKMKMNKMFNQSKPKELNGICLFFGVTGIGKTTTIVKLANKFSSKGKVGIVSTDNFKVGAYKQIEDYSIALDLPLIKSEINDLDFPINRLKFQKGIDHILIDTAGRSPKHITMREEIENYMDEIKPDHNILVLPANQKYEDMKHTVESFGNERIDEFIITKTDETKELGFIVNLVNSYGIGVSYITNGQEVPGDLLEFDADILINSFFENM